RDIHFITPQPSAPPCRETRYDLDKHTSDASRMNWQVSYFSNKKLRGHRQSRPKKCRFLAKFSRHPSAGPRPGAFINGGFWQLRKIRCQRKESLVKTEILARAARPPKTTA